MESRILKSKYSLPEKLSSDAKDLIKKLIVAQPERRMTISQIKKHSFFSKINWKQVAEGVLEMPKPILKDIKPRMNLSFMSESDNEDDQYSKSSEGEEGQNEYQLRMQDKEEEKF